MHPTGTRNNPSTSMNPPLHAKYNLSTVIVSGRFDKSNRRDHFTAYRQVYRVSEPLKQNKPKNNDINSSLVFKRDKASGQFSVKTINLELPKVGSQRAIVKNKPQPCKKAAKETPLPPPPPPPKPVNQLVQKLAKMEDKDQQVDVLDKINNEYIVANAQIEEIKNMLNMRAMKSLILKDKGQTSKVMKGSRKSMGKITSRLETRENKVIDTLSFLNKKMLKMQEKYLREPRVVYKTVKEALTNTSKKQLVDSEIQVQTDPYIRKDDNLEVEKTSSNSSCNYKATIEEIKRELDSIRMAGERIKPECKVSVFTTHKAQDKDDNLDQLGNSTFEESMSSSEMRYLRIRNKIKNVGNLYSDMGNLDPDGFSIEKRTVDLESSNGLSDIDATKNDFCSFNGNSEVFFDSELEESVRQSEYLMKEFNIQPDLKVFCDKGFTVTKKLNTDTEIDYLEKIRRRAQSGQELFQHLDLALKNSLFKTV